MSSSVIWRIVKYDGVTMNGKTPTKGTGSIDWSKSVYCIKAGVGFGSKDETIPQLEEERVYYENEEELKPIAISSTSLDGSNAIARGYEILKTSLSQDNINHNAMLWILDHIYLPKHPNEEEKQIMKKELLEKAFAEEIENEEITDISEVELSDDLIEAIGQLAVWYFTNSDDPKYHVSDIRSIQKTEDPTGNSTESLGMQEEEDAKTLYKYLITTAEKEAPTYASKREGAQISKDASVNTKLVKEESRVLLGPIKINLTNPENIYNLTLSITAKATESQSLTPSYTILNSEKSEIENTVSNINGKEIYIAVNNTNITEMTLNVTGKYPKTTVTKLYAGDQEQPLAVVEKEFIPLSTSITAQKEEEKPQELDLSLRKYITKINNNPVPQTRTPEVITSSIESTRTATYNHRKDAIEINTGDKIIYEIAIYNEGDKPARVSKIIDVLPTGLTFKRIITEGFTGLVDSQNVLTITKTKSNNLNPYAGGELDKEIIEIECQVSAIKGAESKTLKNVAYIAEEVDGVTGETFTQAGKDRDSSPENHPNVTKDTTESHTGDSNNPSDLSHPEYFYKGKEDDDDYEQVVLPALGNGKYTVNLVKVNEKGETITTNSKFSIDGNEKQTANGTLEVASKQITGANVGEVDTYIIKETEAPTGYNKFEGSIELKVHKKQNGENYILDEENTDITVKDASGSVIQENIPASIEKSNGTITIKVKNEITKYFDLSLRKFISSVNGHEVEPSRAPEVDVTPLKSGSKNATYTHSKDAVGVKTGDIVVYTIRVYNEGEVDGYAKEITDNIPEGLAFDEEMVNHPVNIQYMWKLSKDGTKITTNYLARDPEDQEQAEGRKPKNLLKAFDPKTMNTLYYEDVQVAFKVIEPSTSDKTLTNIAEISEDEDKDGNPVKDRDSEPNNGIETEDDIDKEYLELEYFDLSLRKFISSINGEETDARVPKVSLGEDGKLKYEQSKEPLYVTAGDTVVYTIRVYNEGEAAGYAKEVTDDIPEGLVYLPENEINQKYGWKLSSNGKEVTTDYLSKEKSEARKEDNLLKAFDKEKEISNTNPDHRDLQIAFRITEETLTSNRIITNTAEITDDEDKNGDPVDDEDSEPGNKDPEEDDTDKEQLKVKYFDLSLRKFITAVNGHKVEPSREPSVDVSKIKDGTGTTATYTHSKDPVSVMKGNKVIYTIRVYNEGELAGYVAEIVDTLPEGLNFVPASESEINTQYGWEVSADGRKVTTNYLANTLIKAFDKETDETLDYKDIQIECEVVGEAGLRNIAEVSKNTNEEKKEVPDVDSKPNNVDKDNYTPPTDNSSYQEDDDDYEDLAVRKFDLSLRKFITKINEEETNARVPRVSLGEDGKLKYEQSKEPLNVAANDIIIYTIRVYNEGEADGYAKEVTDNVPEGLIYLPENEINKKYGWELSEDGKEITTDYLSKEKSEARNEDNLLKAFDKEKEISNTNPDYRDLQVAFRITETNLSSNRTIINIAEITEDEDKNGDPVEDEDSDPGNKDPEEDDLDKETVKVGYFDLSLLKWVSSVYVTEDGKTTVRKTGHTGAENPEPVVKVDIHRKKIEDVTVKFGYTIKVTNEGEIEGYATEISDYIPEGLKFDKKDNPNWEEKGGKIVTRALENKLLKPGESAEVEVILTWINGENNIGVKTNVAEISEDKNDHNAKDIDSTPNNKKDGEDDIDEAPVMIAVQTGGADDIPKYAALGAVILAILGSGIYLIKKYVL